MIGRRSFVCSLGLLPIVGCAPAALPAVSRPALKAIGSRLKVLCVGAHPDDPESGCGGTLARYVAAGHDVTLLYLTAGENGIEGVPGPDAGKTRTAEAKEACAILGAKPVFVGQVNGHVEVTDATARAFRALFDAEKPDVVFTQWPMDTDPEHQACSLLTLRAFLGTPRATPLYYYEVETGSQTLGFAQSAYVDISATREKKVEALRAHKSQSFEGLYERHHEKMEAFRGRELGVSAAEAFATLGPDARSGSLPGL
jgi:LmbE family N-acetylglucosaminyl deacetylase